eukprot:20985-Heterococcus_DN1.PRE.1
MFPRLVQLYGGGDGFRLDLLEHPCQQWSELQRPGVPDVASLASDLASLNTALSTAVELVVHQRQARTEQQLQQQQQQQQRQRPCESAAAKQLRLSSSSSSTTGAKPAEHRVVSTLIAAACEKIARERALSVSSVSSTGSGSGSGVYMHGHCARDSVGGTSLAGGSDDAVMLDHCDAAVSSSSSNSSDTGSMTRSCDSRRGSSVAVITCDSGVQCDDIPLLQMSVKECFNIATQCELLVDQPVIVKPVMVTRACNTRAVRTATAHSQTDGDDSSSSLQQPVQQQQQHDTPPAAAAAAVPCVSTCCASVQTDDIVTDSPDSSKSVADVKDVHDDHHIQRAPIDGSHCSKSTRKASSTTAATSVVKANASKRKQAKPVVGAAKTNSSSKTDSSSSTTSSSTTDATASSETTDTASTSVKCEKLYVSTLVQVLLGVAAVATISMCAWFGHSSATGATSGHAECSMLGLNEHYASSVHNHHHDEHTAAAAAANNKQSSGRSSSSSVSAGATKSSNVLMSPTPLQHFVSHGASIALGRPASSSSTQQHNSIYEWSKDGVIIAGATQSFYSIPQANATTEGLYTCVQYAVTSPSTASIQPADITSSSSASSSSSAKSTWSASEIRVSEAPTTASEFILQRLHVGDMLALHVKATGVPPPIFQWRLNGKVSNTDIATNAAYVHHCTV